MHQTIRTWLGIAVLCAVVGATPAMAQNITTGTLTGTVMDAQQGVLPGATVVAVHQPTGTTYEAVTQADGRFTMLAVRVGGPYTVSAEMTGFRKQEQAGVEVGLGESRAVAFTLQLETVQETVNVVAAAQVIDTTRAGAAANVGTQTLEALPTISRSLNDFARTSPYFNTNTDSATGGEMVSVAGRSNRYNNMQIDGAVNNDVFGLAATGTPGGQTGTQPVSLDAIQEVQLVVSPYDVRQGGFSGGGINAITKSGTNAFKGSAYLYGRDESLVGKLPSVITPAKPTPTDTKVGEFSDKQYGVSLGGPVVRNKAFFFGNVDWARKKTPVGYSIDGSSGQTWGNADTVQQVAAIAKAKYNYDVGGFGEFSNPNNSNKVFVRADLNVSPRNQLTLRTNWVDAMADIGYQSSTSFKMPTNFYHMTDKMLSNVGQLNSSFGRVFNEFRVTYSRERNKRGGQPGVPDFPEVRVDMPDGTSIYLGTEYSSHANQLNQDIIEVTDDVTMVLGNHTVSVGTHNEFYKFYNLFIQYAFGGYRFNSVANFEAGLAQSYNYNFSNTSNPKQAADFPVYQFGFYAGDKWRARSNFTLTYGVRVDIPRFSEKPNANPVAVANFGYKTDNVPAPVMWSPRVGFNWDLSKSGARRQVRGGVGVFTGRTPYVWLSNQYSNTGVDFTSLSVSYNAANRLPFVANPNGQPSVVVGGTTGRQTINVVDPNYKYPEILRGTFGVDHELPWGLVGTAEGVYTRSFHDIFYQNINYVPAGALPDGRTTFKKFDTNLNDVMLLSNSTDGKSWSVSYKIERPYRRGFAWSASYLYGRAYARNDGTSSVARSNWTNNPSGLNTNDPPLTRSNYDPGHRVNLSATLPIPLFKGLRSSLAFFFNGQSGRPFSIGFNGDANTDSITSNDLLFVPGSADDVVLYSSVAGQTATWDILNNFLQKAEVGDYRGKIIARNHARAPWYNHLDVRYAVTVPLPRKARIELTADVFNFLNLLNKDWGWQYFGNFGSTNLIGYGGIDAATGKMRYNLSTLMGPNYSGLFTRADLRSRWQAQFGARVRF
ncbi:MAG TPA: TonB-dependent receptor [Vicinamibacterales bacterium]|nr:TonB-dependent receptor [Vicinamibacterales bacterium]